MTSPSIYLRLLRYVRPYWPIFLAAVVCMILSAATEPLFAEMLKWLWAGFSDPETSGVYWLPAIIVALFVFRGAATFGAAYLLAWVSNRVVMNIRDEMFDRMLALPTAYYDDHSSGRLISRISNDVNGVSAAATESLTVVIKDSVTAIALIAYLCYLNWAMTLITLIVVPAVLIVVRRFSGRLRRASRQAQEFLGQLVHVVEETIRCEKIVKVFGGQQTERERFGHRNRALRAQAMRQTVASAAISPASQVFVSIALALVVCMALFESSTGRLTAEGFIAFLTAMLLLMSPLKKLADINGPIQKGLAAAESVFVLLDEPPEPDIGTETLSNVEGELRFDNVSFRYPTGERLALDKVSFTAMPGETVALVGASGSGKSTIAALIPRFYTLSSGVIRLDGHDVRELALVDLRSHIALVSQDIILFDDTVAANIAYGAFDVTAEADIVAAAKAANAWDFIVDLPQGLQTMIGDRGLKLSGGQRQRLAIARASLKDAPLLILDEATSALDSDSERKVQAALDRLMADRTTIVIAHRLSTIESADKIIVLSQGHIVEVGTHDALIRQQGVYARLHRLQFSEDGAVEPSAVACDKSAD